MPRKSNIYYNGNPSVKKAGVDIEMSHEQIQEYMKCRSDVKYFIKNYCKIISLDKGLVLFDMFPFQEAMIDAFDQNRFVINLLPRQMGKSTIVAAYLLHYAIFNTNQSVGILANKATTAREILARIKRMLEGLPFFLQPGVAEYNKSSVEFGNGSKLIAGSTSSSSVRGNSFNLIYLDEFAFVDNADEFYTSTYPVISSGSKSKVLITSTPNGMNLFYKIWKDALEGKNDYVPVKVDWWEHPARDEKWKETTLKNIGKEQFSQEYENQFIGSSGTLIAGEKLAAMRWSDPLSLSESMRVYKEPQVGHSYVATVDVAEGNGGDYSVINITDVTKYPFEQVAVYRSNEISHMVLPEVIERISYHYNEAFVLIEVNSLGESVGNTLFNTLEYENMVTTNSSGDINGKGSTIHYGVRTNKKTKRIGCASLKTIIENDLYVVNDFDCISELQTFTRNNNSYEAEKNSTDDIVMTLVLFGWLVEQEYFKDLMSLDSRKRVLEAQNGYVHDELCLVGGFDDGGVDILNENGDDQYLVFSGY